MTVETSTTISGLQDSPLGDEEFHEGDDHLRLLKSVLKLQFPGQAGNGYAKAILATEDELNYLQDLTSNAQEQLDDITDYLDDDLEPRVAFLEGHLVAPFGTILPIYGAELPEGWTAQDIDNRMLRVVSDWDEPATSGGIDSPILNNKVPTHNHTATSAGAGGHSHGLAYGYGAHSNCVSNTVASASHGSCGDKTGMITTAPNHSHGITVNNNAGADNWEPRYINVRLAVYNPS